MEHPAFTSNAEPLPYLPSVRPYCVGGASCQRELALAHSIYNDGRQEEHRKTALWQLSQQQASEMN